MNRKSLFARLADRCAASSSASRQEYFRVHLEPLESRKLLAATHIVSDYWLDVSDPDGSVGYSPSDTLQDPVTGAFGSAGDGLSFGKIAYYNTGTGAWLGTFHNIVDASNNDYSTIHSAIENASTVAGDFVQLEPRWSSAYSGTVVPQTFQESDIVIDKAGITLSGDSSYGASYCIIAPEVASAHAEENFPTGSHSGIILYAPTITVSDLTVDGNAGFGGAGSLNFHQGITTMYDQSGGGNYASQHNGALAPSDLHGGAGGNTGTLTVTGVVVQNIWYKGITISDVASKSFSNTGDPDYPKVINSTVNNIGTGFGGLTQDQINNRTGILMMNVDRGSIRSDTVTNAGVGVAADVFGTPWTGSPDNTHARDHIGVLFCTVTDAVSRGYSMVYEDDSIDSNLLLDINSDFRYGFTGNTASWSSSSNTATGLYLNYSQPYIMGCSFTNAMIGVHIQNTSLTDSVHSVPQIPELTGMTLIGPGSGIPNSVGVLVDNDSSFSHSASAIIGGGTRISLLRDGCQSRPERDPQRCGQQLPPDRHGLLCEQRHGRRDRQRQPGRRQHLWPVHRRRRHRLVYDFGERQIHRRLPGQQLHGQYDGQQWRQPGRDHAAQFRRPQRRRSDAGRLVDLRAPVDRPDRLARYLQLRCALERSEFGQQLPGRQRSRRAHRRHHAERGRRHGHHRWFPGRHRRPVRRRCPRHHRRQRQQRRARLPLRQQQLLPRRRLLVAHPH